MLLIPWYQLYHTAQPYWLYSSIYKHVHDGLQVRSVYDTLWLSGDASVLPVSEGLSTMFSESFVF